MAEPDKINSIFQNNGWVPIKELDEFDETCLTEDLAQFEKDGLVVDFGFYGDESKPLTGEYRIFIVHNQDWENSLARLCFKDRGLALSVFERLPLINLFENLSASPT